MLDTIRAIETPEGVELQFRVAGPVIRALAWSIDASIRLGLYIMLSYLLAWLGWLGVGFFFLTLFLVEWFYPVLFEVYGNGATPGKRTLKISVLQASGAPVNWSSAMIRNLLRAVDMLPLFYGFGLITMLLNKDFQRLGDLAANTVVVYQEKIAPATQKQTIATKTATNFNLPLLTLVEQQAIVNFAERTQALSQQRATELANLVTPLTGQTEEAGRQRLYQIAYHLMGERVEAT